MARSKIIIGILFIIFTVLLFEVMFENRNRSEYDNIIKLGNNGNAIKVVLSVDYNDQENAYEVLKKFLDGNGGNVSTIYTSSQNGKTAAKIYAYFTDKTFFENISLVSGRCFNPDENESDEFLSTDKTNNDAQIGRIADFAGDQTIEIRTLKSKMKEPDTNVFDKYLYINAGRNQNKDVFFESLKETMRNGGYAVQRVEESFFNVEESYYNLVFAAGLSVLYIICMLFIYFDILNSYKKIGVEKMMGFKRADIWKRRILPLISTQLLSMSITTAVLAIIKFKAINKYLFFFMLDLFMVYFFLTVLSLLILSIPFITIRKISVSNMLKNKNPVNAIILVNSAFKVVLSVAVLIIISNLHAEYRAINEKYKFSFENWEKTKGYAVVPAVRNRIGYDYNPCDKENQYKRKELYFYFNKRGAILADFKIYEPGQEINRKLRKDAYEINNITVNPNYLKENIVLDAEGNRIYIDENETEYMLLVPESYRQFEKQIIEYHESEKDSRLKASGHAKKESADPHELPSYHEQSVLPDQDIKIIWTKSNQQLFSYKLDINPRENNMVKDPIIRVVTESNGDLFDYGIIFDGGEPLKIKYDDSSAASDYIQSVLANYYDPNYFQFPVVNLFTMVEDQIYGFRIRMLYNSAIIIAMFGIIFTIILQNVLNYFKQNRVKLAIQKFHGYRNVDKYKGYFILIAGHWLLVLAITIPATRNMLSALAAGVLLATEYAISLLALNRVENVKVLEITKGG